MNAAVRILAALAQDARLAVFRLLVPAGPAGLPAGEIATTLGIPPSTLSFHLGQLEAAGLVSARRSGRSIGYALRAETFRDLLGFLTDDCCGGRPELCFPLTAPAAKKCCEV